MLDQVFERCDVVVQTSPVPFDILGRPADPPAPGAAALHAAAPDRGRLTAEAVAATMQ